MGASAADWVAGAGADACERVEAAVEPGCASASAATPINMATVALMMALIMICFPPELGNVPQGGGWPMD